MQYFTNNYFVFQSNQMPNKNRFFKQIANGKGQRKSNTLSKNNFSFQTNGLLLGNTEYQETSSPSEIDSPSSVKRKRENKGKKKTFLIKSDDNQPQLQKKISKKGYPVEFVEIDQSGILKLGELVEQLFIKYEGYIHLTVIAGKEGSGKSQLLNKLLDISGKQSFQTRKEKEHFQFGTVDLQIFSEPIIIKELNIHCFYLDLQGIDETNISHLKLLLFAFLISDSFIWHTDEQIQYSIHELSVFQQIQEKLQFKFNSTSEEFKIYPHFYYLIKGRTPHSIRINAMSPRGYFKSFIKEELDDYLLKYNFTDISNNSSNYYNNPLYSDFKQQYVQQATTRDFIIKDMKTQEENNKQQNNNILSFDNENDSNNQKQNQQNEMNTFTEALDNSKLSFQQDSQLVKSFKNLSSTQKQNIKQIFNNFYIDKLKLVFYKDSKPQIQRSENKDRQRNISISNNSANSLSFQNQNIYGSSTSSTFTPFSSSNRGYKKPIMSPSLYLKQNIYGPLSSDIQLQNIEKESELQQETIEDVLSWEQYQIQNCKKIYGINYNSRMFLTFIQNLLDQINLGKKISIQQIHFEALLKECEQVSNWCYEQFVEEMLAALGDQMKPLDQLLFISLQIRENTINKYSIYFKQLDFRECSPFIQQRKKLKKHIDSYTKRMFNLYFTTMAGISEIQRKQLSRNLFSQIYESNQTRKEINQQSNDLSINNKITKSPNLSIEQVENENNDFNTSLTQQSFSEQDYTINEIENEEDFESVDGKIKEVHNSRIFLKNNFSTEQQESKVKQLKTQRNIYRSSIENQIGFTRYSSLHQNLKKASGYSQLQQKRSSNPKVSTPSKILISNQEIQLQTPLQTRDTRPSYDGSNQIKEEEQQLSEEACKQNKEKLSRIFNEAITSMRQFTEKYFLQQDECVQYPSISQYQNFIRHTYKKYVEKFTQQYIELYQKIIQQEEFLRFKDLKQMRDILYNRREILSKQDTAITHYIESLKTESQNTQKLIEQTHIFYLKSKDKYKLSLILQQKEEECRKLEEELQRLKGKNKSSQK
ncbi:hypothetical protein TTHERM_00721580 (macronuclear) [Tetrahymena thermophila SB210]|uniref:Uncharacterized protein n=1 Tax=Tetrahymena thermophila (strain SB210) TaxID=312017 RepID=Q22FZ9_TETTS|nr:hypothetical protein TTHERM_00721580 [Tetrahymena thermophila SB210]EAR84227.2 hypothetical protein TTHERM_00721580 [Tetrahymena thermophila SB210]|eukprot:XP_001031890.2 hypothetical protein TTHERM_00721580 [Tetrahymena thermophila SB210]